LNPLDTMRALPWVQQSIGADRHITQQVDAFIAVLRKLLKPYGRSLCGFADRVDASFVSP
jgi:hypothetical protein